MKGEQTMEYLLGIPDSAECEGCAFVRWNDDYGCWCCDYKMNYWEPDDEYEKEDVSPFRCEECLFAYPHGAIITITPRGVA